MYDKVIIESGEKRQTINSIHTEIETKILEKPVEIIDIKDLNSPTRSVHMLLHCILMLDLSQLGEFQLLNYSSIFDDECHFLLQRIAKRASKLSKFCFYECNHENRGLQEMHNATLYSYVNSCDDLKTLVSNMLIYDADLFTSLASCPNI